MGNDLKMIKKKYGEEMMKLCRSLFPTILENDGELFTLISETFAFSRNLYKDIVDNDKVDDFRDFIFEKRENNKKTIIESDKSPQELLRKAGYTLYQCFTEEDIQQFRKYYEPGEELCTFSGDRLKTCYVFFAVKDNALELRRKDFTSPYREDEYGVSVISIQYTRGEYNSLSIKNRYNHSVVNPDATYSNDLDKIVPGLNMAFEKTYHLANVYNYHRFELPGYVIDNKGKFYKYNYEINNIYYCVDNIIIDNFNVIDKYTDKSRYLVIDYFIIDLQKKIVFTYNGLRDSFPDSFSREIEKDNGEKDRETTLQKITISRNKEDDSKIITIVFNNGDIVIIEINKYNQMIKLYDEHISMVNTSYLENNKYLRKLSLPKAIGIRSFFMSENICLEKFFLPCVEIIGGLFLKNNRSLKKINLPEIREIGTYFLDNNDIIEEAYLPKVEIVRKYFMSNNHKLKVVIMPEIKEIGNGFLQSNTELSTLLMPKVRIIDDEFLMYNQRLNNLCLHNLIQIGNNSLSHNEEISFISCDNLQVIGNNFMRSNKKITMLDLPKVEVVGDNFISGNEIIQYVYMPNLKKVGAKFLLDNNMLTEIEFDSLEDCGVDFLMQNTRIKKAILPRLKEAPNGFMYSNICLEELVFDNIENIGDGALKNNFVMSDMLQSNINEVDNTYVKIKKMS